MVVQEAFTSTLTHVVSAFALVSHLEPQVLRTWGNFSMPLIQNDDEVCAHAGCTCEPRLGSKYCSPYCEHEADFLHRKCDCGHAGCGAEGLLAEDPELLPEPA